MQLGVDGLTCKSGPSRSGVPRPTRFGLGRTYSILLSMLPKFKLFVYIYIYIYTSCIYIVILYWLHSGIIYLLSNMIYYFKSNC